MRKTNKENIILTTTNINTITKTPIEIALKIDENGMTTASKLYMFLELNPSHFSRWCNTNIKNNKFALENEDYFPFTIDGERYNPKPKTDYKITSDFAKKLSMTGNTERHEQARQYFIACEQGLKIATQKLQESNFENKLANAIENMNTVLLSLNERISKLEENQIKIQKSLPKKKFSYWSTKMFPKYQLLTDYFNISNRELYKELFKELKNTYPDIELNQIVDDYCYENKLDSCFTLDVIEHNKTIRTAFESMVDGLLEKYNLISEKVIIREKTIFDN